ncbi:MAG: hypothetical protein IT352_15495 [Gemmatimonadales bacterium]|nr:hypothetical protein [Gemmatimonadales bacterium]
MAVGILSGGGGGAVASETYDEAVAAMDSGLVHRWWCDDASGALVDSVGGLSLAVTGTVTRQVVDPWAAASAITFAAGARAEAAAIGSMPLAAADRTMVAVYKLGPTLATSQRLAYYGNTSLTRATFGWLLGAAGEQISGWVALDDLAVALGAEDGDWHITALRLSAARKLLLMFDGRYDARRLGGDAATSGVSSLPTLGFSGNTVPLTVADWAVWNRALTRGELDRLWHALEAARA